LVVVTGLFQLAKSVGGIPTEAQEITMHSLPKRIAFARMQTTGKFEGERPVTGANKIFTQLNFIRRENTDAAPPARNGDIPLLRAGSGLDGGIGKENVIHRLAL
jgi:hypothetical protein